MSPGRHSVFGDGNSCDIGLLQPTTTVWSNAGGLPITSDSDTNFSGY